MKILLADDEQSMRTLVECIVTDEGYGFCVACDGVEALEVFEEEKPDLLILDVMMPHMDGFQVCRKLRERGVLAPVIFLSAKGDIVDKSVGFSVGGDDYLVKPFSPQELIFRIEAHLRKHKLAFSQQSDNPQPPIDLLQAGDLELDVKHHRVSVRGLPASLTPKEFQILLLLASRPGEIITREQIVEEIWGKEYIGETSSIAVFIRKIREKIEVDPSNPRYVQTAWRIGYRFGD